MADQTASLDRPRARRFLLKRPLTWVALIVVLALIISYGLHWWTTGRFVESTNDAYIRADNVTIAPRVAGYVSEVLVKDNQQVRAGQPLVRIDAATYQATLTRQTATRNARQADVAVAEAQRQQQLAAVQQAEARLAGDQADTRYAEHEVVRYRGLAASGAETAERLAEMVNRSDRANSTLRSDQAALLAAQRQADTMQAQIQQAKAQVETAESAIHEAELDLGNTLIRAGIDGRVGDRTVTAGQYVQPGTRLMTIVPTEQIYVVANFKETQLNGMQIGQHASVSVDALDGRSLDAEIDSFAPGTGAEFALLPPENATGNFTKIVQRVPVRLRLQTDQATLERLVPGMSVTASINTQQTVPAVNGGHG